MRNMFYVSLTCGCAIVKAANLTAARKYALAEWGRSFYQGVRRAINEDVGWVTAMGGKIHEA